MAAYIVFTREKTRDPAELATYMDNVSESLVGHPIKLLAVYGRQGGAGRGGGGRRGDRRISDVRRGEGLVR